MDESTLRAYFAWRNRENAADDRRKTKEHFQKLLNDPTVNRMLARRTRDGSCTACKKALKKGDLAVTFFVREEGCKPDLWEALHPDCFDEYALDNGRLYP